MSDKAIKAARKAAGEAARRAMTWWREWWFLNRPWCSARTYTGGTGAAGSQRRAYLRASFLRVTVEIAFPWRRKP